MQIKNLHIFGDSQLVIKQVLGLYEIHKPELQKYCCRARELLICIPTFNLQHIPRTDNGEADVLAKLAKELANPNQEKIHIIVQNSKI